MAKRTVPFINNEFYHVIFRGIDGKTIFTDDNEYYRMIHDIFEFNDKKNAKSSYRKDFAISKEKKKIAEREPRDFLVKVHAFCLMPNHVHLILEQLKDDGISKYMHKLCGGYSQFFNVKHKRKGYLFQGRFKSVYVNSDEQFNFLFVYVHTNPIAIICPNWKEKGIENSETEIIKFIENYKWSSYRDYLKSDNFPSLTQREYFLDIQSKEKWQEFVADWIKYKKEIFNFDRNIEWTLEDEF